ncbi:MAG: hypothetical protein IKL97_05555 [Eggerthellaceae bacterium]|nr:hypothetical protein [Eggerthellaceae bacterium]
MTEEGFFSNLAAKCIPAEVVDMTADDYEAFLDARRKLMAAKVRDYFKGL